MGRLMALPKRHGVALAILAGHAILWTAVDQFISPHPDTIDHWVQGRIWSLGYAEHPPMVAWLLRIFTTALGTSEAALETIALGFNLAILAGTYALAASTFGRRAGVFTLVFLEATLYFTAGSTVFQIDQPLMAAWLASLWALLHYQRTGRGGWLLAMGLFAGLGALSKYTMVLFYVGLGIYITLIPGARREWRNPYQYAGGAMALAVLSPLLYWNARHDWISFSRQLAKGTAGGEQFIGFHSLAFTVGYLLIFSAVLIAWGAPILWRRARGEGRRDSATILLLTMSLTPILFFTLVLLRGSYADPKWANLGFLGLFILMGREAAERWEAGRRRGLKAVLAGAYGVQIVLLAVVFAHMYHPLIAVNPRRDPTRQVVGWSELGREVDALLSDKAIPPPRFVVSYFYPLASQMALHLSSQPLTYSLERPWRNLWSDPREMTRDNTLLVCQHRCPWLHGVLRRNWGVELETLGEVESTVGGVVRQRLTLLRMAESAEPPERSRLPPRGPNSAGERR